MPEATSAATLFMFISAVARYEPALFRIIHEQCGVYKNEKPEYNKFIKTKNISALIDLSTNQFMPKSRRQPPFLSSYDSKDASKHLKQIFYDKTIKYYFDKEKTTQEREMTEPTLVLYGLYGDCSCCPILPIECQPHDENIHSYIIEIINKKPYFSHHSAFHQNKDMRCDIIYHTDTCYEVVYDAEVRTETKTIKRHKKRNTYKSKTEKYTKSYFVVYIL